MGRPDGRRPAAVRTLGLDRWRSPGQTGDGPQRCWHASRTGLARSRRSLRPALRSRVGDPRRPVDPQVALSSMQRPGSNGTGRMRPTTGPTAPSRASPSPSRPAHLRHRSPPHQNRGPHRKSASSFKRGQTRASRENWSSSPEGSSSRPRPTPPRRANRSCSLCVRPHHLSRSHRRGPHDHRRPARLRRHPRLARGSGTLTEPRGRAPTVKKPTLGSRQPEATPSN
jgi:hypothetical protein